MSSFSFSVVGGPADGDVWSQVFRPDDGDELVERSPFDKFDGPHSVYRFDAAAAAWIFVATLKRDEYLKRLRERQAGHGDDAAA